MSWERQAPTFRPTNKVLVYKLSDSIGWSNSIQSGMLQPSYKPRTGAGLVQGADVLFLVRFKLAGARPVLSELRT
jgi:hypothetical protein